jgi:hypothetical protein
MKPNEFEGKSHPFLHRGQKRHKKPGKQIKKGVAYCRRLAGRTYQLSSGGQVSLRIEKSPRRRCRHRPIRGGEEQRSQTTGDWWRGWRAKGREGSRRAVVGSVPLCSPGLEGTASRFARAHRRGQNEKYNLLSQTVLCSAPPNILLQLGLGGGGRRGKRAINQRSSK